MTWNGRQVNPNEIPIEPDSTIDPFVAACTAEPMSGVAPLTVAFRDMSRGEPSSWLWEFGNGRISTSQHPTTTYTEPDDHTVKLTVSAGGKPRHCTMTIEVHDPLDLLGCPIASREEKAGSRAFGFLAGGGAQTARVSGDVSIRQVDNDYELTVCARGNVTVAARLDGSSTTRVFALGDVVVADRLDGDATAELNSASSIRSGGKIDGSSNVPLCAGNRLDIGHKIDGSAQVQWGARSGDNLGQIAILGDRNVTRASCSNLNQL